MPRADARSGRCSSVRVDVLCFPPPARFALLLSGVVAYRSLNTLLDVRCKTVTRIQCPDGFHLVWRWGRDATVTYKLRCNMGDDLIDGLLVGKVSSPSGHSSCVRDRRVSSKKAHDPGSLSRRKKPAIAAMLPTFGSSKAVAASTTTCRASLAAAFDGSASAQPPY